MLDVIVKVILVWCLILIPKSEQIKSLGEYYANGTSLICGDTGQNANEFLEQPQPLSDVCMVDDLRPNVLIEFTRKSTDHYVAGVVEYKPNSNADPFRRTEINLGEYLNFIKSAQQQDVDIIVFPEATLNMVPSNRTLAGKTTTEVPDPTKNVIPCNRLNLDKGGAYNEIMVPLSCAAKSNKLYIVVNLSEQEKCTVTETQDPRPCANDGLNFFNTDVVFDRTGAVVARYRKYNLFGERNMNTTIGPEHSTFTTDFDVRFGLFTCFDIMFKEPALSLVREDVRDFIFPTMWFSELPFLTALQIQEYWSFTNNVNLLASGASNTFIGSGGSGIYAGVKGPLIKYISIPGHDNNKLLVAKVPKHGSFQDNSQESGFEVKNNKIVKKFDGVFFENDANMDAFYMKRDEIDRFTSEVIGENFVKKLCNGDLCCTFDVTTKFLNRTAGKESYQYRAIVGDVRRSFSGVANGGVKACAIVACSGSDFKHCAKRFPQSRNVAPLQIFEKITIRGDFPDIEEVLTMPDTLAHTMSPLKAGSFSYEEHKTQESVKTVLMSLTNEEPVEDLQTFGIYGRDFRKDGKIEEADMTYFQYNVVLQ